MLKPRNDYRWSEIVKKSELDEAFKQLLISEPRKAFAEEVVDILSNIELKIVGGNEDLFIVIPHPSDVSFIEPVDDVWSQILQHAYADKNFMVQFFSDLQEFRFNDTQFSNSGLGSPAKLKVNRGEVIIQETDLDVEFFIECHLLHDTQTLKHFVLPIPIEQAFLDISKWIIRLPRYWPLTFSA
jgi:hypothetical protein